MTLASVKHGKELMCKVEPLDEMNDVLARLHMRSHFCQVIGGEVFFFFESCACADAFFTDHGPTVALR